MGIISFSRLSKLVPLLSVLTGLLSFGMDIANEQITQKETQEYISKEVRKQVAERLKKNV